MTSIDAVTLEVADPTAAAVFYKAAFDLGDRLRLTASEVPTSGYRGFTLALGVSEPATVDALLGAAIDAGATALKPPKKSIWGYGGVVQAPDGTIWKASSSAKKNSGPATREIDAVVLLLGVADIPASKQFYVERGLPVGRSFARKYVEFSTTGIQLALLGRRALAKDAGVPRMATDHTGSSSPATPAPSSTRTASRGRQREPETKRVPWTQPRKRPDPLQVDRAGARVQGVQFSASGVSWSSCVADRASWLARKRTASAILRGSASASGGTPPRVDPSSG